jgi:hypothetical protein
MLVAIPGSSYKTFTHGNRACKNETAPVARGRCASSEVPPGDRLDYFFAAFLAAFFAGAFFAAFLVAFFIG